MPKELSDRILRAGLNKIEALTETRRKLDVEICALRYETQRLCEHPIEKVVETSYRGCSIRSFRVCTVCGYAEEGCLYYRLHNLHTVRSIDRDEAIKLVRGRVLDYEAQETIRRQDEERLRAGREETVALPPGPEPYDRCA
jgi:hypothetical protein